MLGAFAAKHLRHHIGHVGQIAQQGLRCAFEAAKMLHHVVGEADLPHLAVADRVDTDLALALHDVGDRFARTAIKRVRVDRLFAKDVVQHLGQIVGPGQAAGVGRQNPLGAELHARPPVRPVRDEGERPRFQSRQAYNDSSARRGHARVGDEVADGCC